LQEGGGGSHLPARNLREKALLLQLAGFKGEGGSFRCVTGKRGESLCEGKSLPRSTRGESRRGHGAAVEGKGLSGGAVVSGDQKKGKGSDWMQGGQNLVKRKGKEVSLTLWLMAGEKKKGGGRGLLAEHQEKEEEKVSFSGGKNAVSLLLFWGRKTGGLSKNGWRKERGVGIVP